MKKKKKNKEEKKEKKQEELEKTRVKEEQPPSLVGFRPQDAKNRGTLRCI